MAAWSLYGPNLLCMAVVPALCTAWFHEQVHARLPHNYFIYFFVTVFLGSALAFNLAGLARVAILAAGDTLDAARVGDRILCDPAADELWRRGRQWHVHGMAVVYRPRWVMSFDDRLYLAKGR